MTSGKKIIVIPYEGYKCGNRDHCRHFSVTCETKAKFLIVFVRLILEKVEVDGFTGSQRKSDIRLKNNFYLSSRL